MAYFPVHAHSEYSWVDGMGTIPDMVATVAKHGQPALALTDHGVMSGSIRLYKECKKHDMIPFPGSEMYFVTDVYDEDARNDRYHMGMLALNRAGYEALIRLSSWSHTRERFHRKPLIDWEDLYALSQTHSEDIAITTGCYFGLVVQTLVRTGDPEAAKTLIKALNGLFTHTFVELQNHRTPHADGWTDVSIASTLYGIAQELGLPVVAGQDSHYCDKSHKDLHDMMKSICYFGDNDDFAFPGNSYHLASDAWMRKLYLPWWSDIKAGHEELLSLNTLVLPELDTYKFHVPSMSKFPDDVLKRQVMHGLEAKDLHIWEHYEQRIKYELNIIKQMGFANYFLVVKKITDWCRKNGVIVNARGSANGCLVAYALGITEVDPIYWDTSFDRFLSIERMKPPDIDLDVESTQRGLLIGYVKSLFPTAVQIGTYGKLGVSNEWDPDDESGNDQKGSVFVKYHAAMRSRGEYTGKIPPRDYKRLVRLNDISCRTGPGAHAAGFVLPGDDLPIDRHLPTMLIASSNTTVTQPPMDDVEDAGYLKLDILGLRSLATVNKALGYLGRKPNDFGWIPWDDKKTCRVLSSGKTEGIFQYEGYSTMKGAKEMKIKNTYDAILCLALYRPALMNGGQTERFLELRRSGKRMTYHSVIDHILDDSYGVPVFQEHVMRILKAIGMSDADWNDMMKAVKASNDKIAEAERTFERLYPVFRKCLGAHGATRSVIDQVWATIMEFTDYGFNKAHATSYGIMAYRAAYLKAHHPLEYMAGLLQVWAGTKKELRYVQEARRLGIKTVKPDVNVSDVSWTIDRSRPYPAITKGLLSIDGVGEPTAECIISERDKNGPYTSVEDMIERLPARPVSGGKNYLKTGEFNGVFKKLQDAGALRSIGV